MKILQLKIRLEGIRPFIWRKFLVEDSISFHKLHEIIQWVMGWENYHLYEFRVGGLSILEPHEDYMQDVTDSRKTRLSHILTIEKQKFGYLYDFGDSWEHMITVEKILEKASSKKYPVCITGKRACPPEDCGGIWGYQELLEIRKDKNHPEYEERIVEWLGEDFDPEHFDVDEINKSLGANRK
jgi:hypothetical protein